MPGTNLSKTTRDVSKSNLVLLDRDSINAFVPICGICQGSVCDNVVTKCGHLYCSTCIIKWGVAKGTCPDCRCPFNPQRDLCKIPHLASAGDAWRNAEVSPAELTDIDKGLMTEANATIKELKTQLERWRSRARKLKIQKEAMSTRSEMFRAIMEQNMRDVADSLKRSMNCLRDQTELVQREVDNCCIWLDRGGNEAPSLGDRIKRRRVIIDELEMQQTRAVATTTTVNQTGFSHLPPELTTVDSETSSLYSPMDPNWTPTLDPNCTPTSPSHSPISPTRPSTSPVYDPNASPA